MKKILYILLSVCLFIACSSDENSNTEIPNAFNGTKWEYTSVDPKDNSYLTHTLIFKSNTECTLILKGFVAMAVYLEAQYIYEITNNKQIKLVLKNDETKGYNAVIDGDNMKLTSIATGNYFVTLSKIN
jgi:hypothetical protein